jgi:hypothetical protein
VIVPRGVVMTLRPVPKQLCVSPAALATVGEPGTSSADPACTAVVVAISHTTAPTPIQARRRVAATRVPLTDDRNEGIYLVSVGGEGA